MKQSYIFKMAVLSICLFSILVISSCSSDKDAAVQSSAKEITSFSIASPVTAPGVITGANIAVLVPNGTDVTALVATFTTTGSSVTVAGTTQISGVTPNNFTTSVTYRVTAANGSTTDYIVTVTEYYETTLNPVLDFYINRTFNTDDNVVEGYGTDSLGTSTTGNTGSETGYSVGLGYNYQNYFKLLFNFNISSLSGANIQSAYFRIYLNGVSGTDTPPNAILENIFYSNTDSFPPAVRDYSKEFGGYIEPTAVSGTAAATTAGWIQIDVTAKVQADIAAVRNNSQYRLSHENASSLLNFSCGWNMADNVANQPELVVTYIP
jgi:hypothetical protein